MTDASRPDALTVGIVVYRPDLDLLRRCIERLAEAARSITPTRVSVTVVDNGPDDASPRVAELVAALSRELPSCGLVHRVGHGNVGYGRANNLAIAAAASRWHLILNPDAELAPDGLRHGLQRLRDDPSVGLVAATTRGPDGRVQSLVKTYPSVLVLAMRALGLSWFRARVAAYDVAPGPGDATDVTGACVSGSFMLCRTEALQRIGGFDSRYFLYFEDFDLSLRMARIARLVWDHRVEVVHHGGGAAHKGPRHVRLFATSAVRFFTTHGWRAC